MRRVGLMIGSVVLAGGLVTAALDLRTASRRWSTMGPLSPGTPVPEFRVDLLAGGELTREDLIGRISVVTFWASWCGVCSSEMPMYADLAGAHDKDAEVQVILVNREGSGVSPASARPIVARTARERGLQMPLAIDNGSLYAAMGARVLPHTVVVDRRGIIRHVHPGRVLRSTLEAEVARLRQR